MRKWLFSICLCSMFSAVLAAEIDIGEFGAKPDDGADDARAFHRAMQASKAGDTIRFGPGVFDFSDTLVLRANRVYQGSDNTILRFNTLPHDTYAIAIEADATDVTIRGFSLVGGGIRLSDGQQYRNIRIVDNQITQTSGTPGVYCSIAADQLIIERNRIHDFNHWGVIAFHLNRSSISGNIFHNIEQGAHVLAPRDDCVFSFNHGTRLTRMGIEVQRLGDVIARNIVVEGNVFYDWKRPFRDSFGLSIVADESINTRIISNYVRANFSGPWNEETARDGQGKRFGFGIEAGFASGVVDGNTVGGPWANHIVVSHKKTPVKNNRLFGRPVWRRYIETEPGPRGRGSFVLENNKIESDMTRMPLPPGIDDVTASVTDDWRAR